MKKTVIFLLFCCLSGFSFTAFAQSGVLRLQTISLPESMSGKNIRRVIKDKTGLLWIVTSDGLYRYNGRELLHFDLNSKPALPALPITALQADGRGNLWLGFHHGAARFNLKTWKITSLNAYDWKKAKPQDRNISAIACLKDGNVYFGTESGKLYVTKGEKQNHSGDNLIDPSLQMVINLPEGRKKGKLNVIMNIQEPIPGQLWISTGRGMLVCLPIKSHDASYGTPVYFKPKEAEGEPIANICYDGSGQCLFSAGSGLYLANIKKLYAQRKKVSQNPDVPAQKGYVKQLHLPEGEPNNFFSPFYISGKKVAVFTDGKMQPKNIYTYNFQTGNWKLITPSSPIQFPGKNIMAVSDAVTATYICSSGGVTSLQYRNDDISLLLHDFNSNNSIRSIYKDGKYLYISSYTNYFIRYNVISGISERLRNLYVYSMLRWNADTLLLATEGNGLYWYLMREDRFIPISLKNDKGNNADFQTQGAFTTALCRATNHLVLAGTYHGVYLVNPIKGIRYPIFTDSLSTIMQSVKINAIIPLHTNAGDNYLVATNAGTFEINISDGSVRYFLQNKTKDQRRKSVYNLLRMNGKIWMGTNGQGVQIADTMGTLIPDAWLNKELSNRIVYSMAKSANHVLIGTNKGLNILNLKDSSVIRYSTYNGLPSEEFNQSAFWSNTEEAYLGTTNGIVHWEKKMSNNKQKKQALKINFSKLTIVNNRGHQKMLLDFAYRSKDSQQIVLHPEARYLSVSFDKPDIRYNQMNFFYRLKTDEPWKKLGRRRELTFVNMHPGHYRLQFAARTPDGAWMQEPMGTPILVKPAFLQTIWFKILLGLMIVGFIWLIFHYREMQRNKERNLRMRIAGDLHDEVGSSLTQIWHQAQNELSGNGSGADQEKTSSGKKGKEKNRLNAIANTSREALSMMSDMVWSIDARYDKLEELILRMKDYVYRLKSESGISIRIAILGSYENKKVSQAVRQNLFLLFKEGINNAIKHGDGNFIGVRIEFDDKLVMQIENSYNADEQSEQGIRQGGRGLAIMQHRAKNMQAELKFRQEEDTFILLVKV